MRDRFRIAVIALLTADAAIIALHLVSKGAAAFDLDAEGNVPTWYSSVKLLAIAGLALAAGELEKREGAGAPRYRHLWLGVAGLFAALSLDETASLHERAARFIMAGDHAGNLRALLLGGDAAKDSFAWVVLFAPAVVAVLFFLAGFAWSRRDRLGEALWLGAAGLLLYMIALGLEPAAMYFTPPLETWDEALTARYRVFYTLEECCEVIGTSLLVLTVFHYVSGRTPKPE